MSEKPYFPTTVRVGETISVVDAAGNPVAELVVPRLEDFQDTVPMAGRISIFFKGMIRKAGLRPDGIPSDVIEEFKLRFREKEQTLVDTKLYRPNIHDLTMIGWKVSEYTENLTRCDRHLRRDIYFAKSNTHAILFTHRDVEYEE